MSKILESLKSKWLRESSLTVVLILIIVGVFGAFNLWIKSLDLNDIDMTKESVYTLTEESKVELSKIPENEKIDVYLFDYIENSGIVDLAKQYNKFNENINIFVVSSTDRADLASKYEIENGSYSILVLSGDKYKVLSGHDLYTTDYSSGDTIDLTEQKLTNGIIDVSSIGKTTTVYLLSGHEEYGVQNEMSLLKEYLALENYEIKSLDLLVQENVPEDCAALIVASPKKDFAEFEAEKIKSYIGNGGNLLWLNDAFSATEELKNAQSVLDLYGVTIHQDGIMYEQDVLKMAMQNPYLILPDISNTELAGDLATKGAIMMIQASKLTFADDRFDELGVVKTDLLTTSDKAFYRTDLSIANNPEATDKDEVGKQVVSAILEKTVEGEKTSKLVVFANNYFVTDGPVVIGQTARAAITLYNNRDMIINAVSYVSDVEDGIAIRKAIAKTYYTPTEMQDRVIRWVIYGVPALIIVAGIVVWQMRRRKK